ncbi:serine protease [Streptomyces sp. NPDC000594]|uniref:serine protease n=1 Tax=Streptomyces sp. NPDC000594 TaxID=3154261 RepID=UPI003318EA11
MRVRGIGRFGRAVASALGAVLVTAGLVGVGAGPASAIVGGTDAPAGAYPYQVLLHSRVSGGWQPGCGGSVIGERWVLTAAHCLENARADRMRVVVGSNTIDPTGTAYGVQEVIRHENYNGNAAGVPNDIGLLKLSTPIVYTPLVQPIALPDPLAYPGGSATVTGWGKLSSDGPRPNTLQQATVTILPLAECQLRWLGQNITTGHVCTFDKATGLTPCEGDSGSPLAQNGRVLGIVSWGHSVCSNRFPAVYTNVAAHRPWITAKTGI